MYIPEKTPAIGYIYRKERDPLFFAAIVGGRRDNGQYLVWSQEDDQWYLRSAPPDTIYRQDDPPREFPSALWANPNGTVKLTGRCRSTRPLQRAGMHSGPRRRDHDAVAD